MTTKTVVRVALPFKQAVPRAAHQNFHSDVRTGRVSKTEWKKLKTRYYGQARVLLLRDGENRYPTPPDTDHIVLAQ